MAKKITGYIKLTIPGGLANPAPPVGPALGQKGVQIMEFCNQFNDRTKESKGIPLPVVITVYDDRSFTFITKQPPNSYFLKTAAKLKSGSKTPGRETLAQLTTTQLRKIAEGKIVDMNTRNIDSAVKTLAGSARSMGIEVVEG